MRIHNIILSTLFSLAIAFSLITASAQSVRITPNGPVLDTSIAPIAQYEPPVIYSYWMKTIAECENLPLPPQAELDRLRYFVVNAATFKINDLDGNYIGLAMSREHFIILSLPYTQSYSVVAHEFLHFLLWYNYGTLYQYGNVHPVQYFSKCNINPN